MILLSALMAPTMLTANNITVIPALLTGQITAGKYMMVQFDINWDNSWRTSLEAKNWDAAWVFLKYRESGGEWKHALLNYTGHTAPAGSTIDIGLWKPEIPFDTIANPGLGAFIYRSAEGTGSFSLSGVQLRWNYRANGVAVNTSVDIQVFAIEMVYVPKCTFKMGSGGTEAGAFYKYPSTTDPYQITGEGVITIGTNTGNLFYGPGIPLTIGDHAGPIPAAFPKGYAAFYCMKYEIRQQDYVDFLNSLTYSQQETRTVNPPSSLAGTAALTISTDLYRNGIDIMTSGVSTTTPAVYACNLNNNSTYSEPDDGQWIACNDLIWADVAAYLDWSGLRPMTELEFEKACRGTVPAVANENAWGTTGIAVDNYTIINGGSANEVIDANYSTTVGNAAYTLTTPLNGSINGPVRVGIFAGTPGNTGRVTAGATYYGIMEMSGNLWERPVTVGNTIGRTFTGTHGDGTINAIGNADAPYWPGTSAIGAGQRGGAWSSKLGYLSISSRISASTVTDNRLIVFGGRGNRLAPPTFTTSLSLEVSFCVEDIGTATYYPDTMDIQPIRPDHYLFHTGDLNFDINLATYPDYCCDPGTSVIQWQIDFTPTPDPQPPHNLIIKPPINGIGEPSLNADIEFPGDGVYYTDIVHIITYHITDCNGNVSLPIIRYITIKPRPNVIKQ